MKKRQAYLRFEKNITPYGLNCVPQVVVFIDPIDHPPAYRAEEWWKIPPKSGLDIVDRRRKCVKY